MLGSRVKSEYMKLKEWLKDENDSPEPSYWAKPDWMVPVLIGGGSRTIIHFNNIQSTVTQNFLINGPDL